MGVWGVAGLYVAGVIGAGFASGQELIVFFVNYGAAGLVGALWAVLLLLLGTGLILESCAKHRASSYGQLFRALDRKLSILLEGLYGLFLLVGSSVMFAGMGAAASSPGKDLALRICSALLVYAILRGGVSSVVKVGGWLAPLLAVGLCGVAVMHLRQQPWVRPGPMGGWAALWPALEAGTLYACYNLGFALAYLASSSRYLTEKGQRWLVALVGSGVLGLTMLLLYFALGTLSVAQLQEPFPLANLVRGWGNTAVKTYTLLLWCAMFSTAAANSLALSSWFAQLDGLNWGAAALVAVGAGLAFSHLGFTRLISLAYPILGLAGLWLLAQVVRDAVS